LAIDEALAAKARARLDEKRNQHQREYDRRLDTVYASNPCVRALDEELRATIADVIALALKEGRDMDDAFEDIRLRNLDLQRQRLEEIKRAGFSETYLDEAPMCQKCGDIGYVDSKMCSCLMALYTQEQKNSLSSLLKLGGETFDSFDLSFYSDTPNPSTGVSPRQSMEFVYETCVQYATKFGSRSMNLFFSGGTGLGKTFLSACIARVVAESGFSVVYDTANSIFSKFEDEKFSKSENIAKTRDEIKRYLECDLLIVDDLGTEMTTAFTVSALYELINSRLISNKKTVISSNLSINALKDRYSAQIMSRLEGEYQVLMFYGEDIRIKKKL